MVRRTHPDSHAPPGFPPGLRCPPLRRRSQEQEQHTNTLPRTANRRRGLDDDNAQEPVVGLPWDTE